MKEKGILNPQDAELEEAVLGACLVESEAISLVADKLRPEIFYNEQNRMIFAVIQAMFRAGKQIDILTVKNELASCGNLEKVGGPYTLVRLASRVASGAHLEYHACILREMYVRREVILGSYKLLAAASDESVDIADVLAGIHDLLDHLEGEMGTADHLRTMGQLMEDTMVQVEARVEGNRNGITGIPTDFTDLDKLTAGWHRGDLDVIAATPPGSRKNGLCIASGQGSGNSGIFGSGFQSGNAGRAFGRPLVGCCRRRCRCFTLAQRTTRHKRIAPGA